jgi:hypothetical protein
VSRTRNLGWIRNIGLGAKELEVGDAAIWKLRDRALGVRFGVHGLSG